MALEQKVRATIIEVESKVNVNGAVLKVYGEEIGQSPLANSRILRRVRHIIKVSREGYIAEKRKVILENDQSEVVSLKVIVPVFTEQGGGGAA